MLLSSQSEKEQTGSAPSPNPVAVREQLKRLLAHSLFTNSKRYPVLLSYTVEQTLLGNAGELKERSIGVEAFGREPTYDVNLDPVVRTTAAEVRRRLIQYYYNLEHAGELVIELHVGSYIPVFREPAPVQNASTANSESALDSQAASQDSSNLSIPPLGLKQPADKHVLRRRLSIALGLLLAVFVGFGVGRIRFPKQPSNLEQFWEPLTSASGRITYCLGEPVDTPEIDQENLSQGMPRNGGLDVSDVITLARSIVPLVPRHDAFRVASASQTGFAQLREGPVVLIGTYDNIWTLRITQDLPFGFETENNVRKLVDRKSAQQRFWTLEWQVPKIKLAKDYAIVARIHDSVTGQPVIVLAGILGEGTEAASEVVSNPVYLNAMLQKAPRNWEQLNLEAVIETNVIEGHPGPPTIIAVETW
jgi:hypothetical protein